LLQTFGWFSLLSPLSYQFLYVEVDATSGASREVPLTDRISLPYTTDYLPAGNRTVIADVSISMGPRVG